ncbi:hypothetical protein BDZ91DRAFT_850397 [Kalaharituber pfeilii]|nr:hypothetical protein BDZ91DRAFT_850397 [Kalaharituber pfeilii]
MDSRFPLHASIPDPQRSNSLADVDFERATNDSRSASPPMVAGNPPNDQALSAPLPTSIQSPEPSYSPHSGLNTQTAFGPVQQYQANLLPPTIPNLSPETSFSIPPLPFQHEHRNQVPVEGEYPTPVPIHDEIDAILPPPPYTRYAQQPKPDHERRRPQLEMIDVAAAVRGLPTVHVAAGSSRNVNNVNNTEVSTEDATPPFALNNSDSEVSVQSANGSTFSTNSNHLLVTNRSNKTKEKIQDNKRVCGIKLWWILLGIAFISVLLSIVLGVTLGIVLKQSRQQQNQNNDDQYNDDQPYYPPPEPIPRFPAEIQEITVTLFNQSHTCLSPDSRLPGQPAPLDKVLWPCHIPQNRLQIQIESSSYFEDAIPSALPPKGAAPLVPEFLISSAEGINDHIRDTKGPTFAKERILMEGVQPPSFYHQPLYRVGNQANSNINTKRYYDTEVYQYRFLYTKEIILKTATIEEVLKDLDNLSEPAMDISFNSTQLAIGETFWWCQWKLTYMEGLVWMELLGPSNRTFGNNPPELQDLSVEIAGSTKRRKKPSPPPKRQLRYTVKESRISQEEIDILSPRSSNKAEITCQRRVVGLNGSLIVILGTSEDGASNDQQSTALLEAQKREVVENVVRNRFGGSVIRKWKREPSTPLEEGEDGLCMCEWRL